MCKKKVLLFRPMFSMFDLYCLINTFRHTTQMSSWLQDYMGVGKVYMWQFASEHSINLPCKALQIITPNSFSLLWCCYEQSYALHLDC